MGRGTGILKFDWITIALYIALVGFGWTNIYSASLSDTSTAFFDFNQIYIKQLLFIGLSFILIVFILAI
jgi:rod shape determining protein RodA